MPSLKEQLATLLPQILPDTPENAINGTELIELVRGKLTGSYTENTLRVHFSTMAADSTSVIAKVDHGHGYYLRKPAPSVPISPTAPSAPPDAIPSTNETSVGINAQPEEKFRALFIRYAELGNRFPMRIDHTRAARADAGVNRWKFPDVILLDWEVGHVSDDGYRLDRNLLEVKRSLGEQPFRLTSVELKASLTLTNFRESLFQCVSNSKWAHHSLLAVAMPVDDTTLVEELQRLGTSYDVTIVSYSLDPHSLPSAEEIRTMTAEQFDEQAKLVKLSTIATGRQRTSLDWEHIKDMRDRTDDFVALFEWIAYCLKEGTPYSHADFLKISKLHKSYA